MTDALTAAELAEIRGRLQAWQDGLSPEDIVAASMAAAADVALACAKMQAERN